MKALTQENNMTNDERRTFMKKAGLATLAAAGGMTLGETSAGEYRVPFSSGTELPKLRAPAGATDCHIHFYDDRFPAAASATLRPPNATIEDYRLFQQRVGTSRTVIVTPSTYGTDNRPSLEAAAKLGASARVVAVVDDTVSDAELQQLPARACAVFVSILCRRERRHCRCWSLSRCACMTWDGTCRSICWAIKFCKRKICLDDCRCRSCSTISVACHNRPA